HRRAIRHKAAKSAVRRDGSQRLGLAGAMLCQAFFSEKIQLSVRGIRSYLSVPPCVRIFDEPLAQTGEGLIVEALNFAFDLLDFGHVVRPQSSPIIVSVQMKTLSHRVRP